MRKYQLSASGKSVIVTENVFNALGLPISRKTGIIRPQEGADMEAIVAHLEAGDVNYKFQDKPQSNGIYEMDYVDEVAATNPATAGKELETA